METPVKSTKLRKLNIDNGNFGTPLKIPASPYLEKLGYGTGVEVIRLKRITNPDQISSPWAVKRISLKCVMSNKLDLEKRLYEEAQFMKNLDHPNIVGFRAFKRSNDGRECLAMEDCSRSLGDILEERFESSTEPLDVKQINKVCLDISSALDYLHTVVLVLHGDIKSFNVLIKGDFEICKLCDFGVSQPVDKDGYFDYAKKPDSTYIGTDLWSANEVFLDRTNVTIKADIFSFGLVIYEMIALQPPHTLNMNMNETIDDSFNESQNNSVIVIPDDSFDETKEKSFSLPLGTRPSLPDVFNFSEEYNHIIELYFICTNSDPESRPTAAIINKLIQSKMA